MDSHRTTLAIGCPLARQVKFSSSWMLQVKDAAELGSSGPVPSLKAINSCKKERLIAWSLLTRPPKISIESV
jgi:hypothetical protein